MIASATGAPSRMLRALTRPFAVLTRTTPSFRSNHTGVTCGVPSGITVARLAKAFFCVNRSRYCSVMSGIDGLLRSKTLSPGMWRLPRTEESLRRLLFCRAPDEHDLSRRAAEEVVARAAFGEHVEKGVRFGDAHAAEDVGAAPQKRIRQEADRRPDHRGAARGAL